MSRSWRFPTDVNGFSVWRVNPRPHARLDDPAEGADPAATASAVGDEGAGGCQRSADSRQGLRFHVVEDDVVALSRPGEVRSSCSR